MEKLEFKVVLRPEVKLLIDRVNELIEDDVTRLRERINGVLREIDYNQTDILLAKDMNELLRRVVPSRIGDVELVDCNVSVHGVDDEVHINGFVKFNTPQYIGNSRNTIDVSVAVSREIAEWYLTWLKDHEIIEEILTEKRNYGFRLMFGFRDFSSKATITHEVKI